MEAVGVSNAAWVWGVEVCGGEVEGEGPTLYTLEPRVSCESEDRRYSSEVL